MDAYFKQPYRNYSDVYLNQFKAGANAEHAADKKLRDSVALNPKPALSLAKYTGKYVNELYGSLEITEGETNDLEIRFEHHPKMFAKLQPLGGNRFFATFSDPVFGKAVFTFRTQSNKATGVQVKVADFIEYTPYEFVKK